MNLRKLIRIFHRDLGYIFFGMSVIYGVSGIALNHKEDWNPNYAITQYTIELPRAIKKDSISKAWVTELLARYQQEGSYKKHYFQNDSTLKVFINGGFLTLDLKTGTGFLETIRKRPILRDFNILHYNNIKHLWTWFSDLFALALIIMAVTGLFMIQGQKGITGRGAWLTALGLIIPLLFLLIYL
jgi:uncharacterized protein